jgi:hypothetical protein
MQAVPYVDGRGIGPSTALERSHGWRRPTRDLAYDQASCP